MGLIDRLDDILTDARGRSAATREATRFARSVKLNTSYYAVARHAAPEGGEMELVHEYVFTRRSPITDLPMCGPHSAAHIWLNHGPLTANRPRKLMTVAEYEAACDVDGPNIVGSLHEYGPQRVR